METETQRHNRRVISGWLTAEINDKNFRDGLGAHIRMCVLNALQKINVEMKKLNAELIEKEGLVPGRNYVLFYGKGGNAFDCVLDPTGDKATQDGGGTSDWDTQIVIDPWLPENIQIKIYATVEDLVQEIFQSTAIYIVEQEQLPEYKANSFPHDFVEQIVDDWNNSTNSLKNNYSLSLDSPQSFRKIFDHDKTGLWINNNQSLPASANIKRQWISGITFNDAIKPFVLWRLGYTWHAEVKTSISVPNQSDALKKPILMELIDVTIPRSNTIEAIEVWSALENQHIQVEHVKVSVTDKQQLLTSVTLPLPNFFYHLSEVVEMMCEIADGSSNHKDKFPKRIKRFVGIWDAFPQSRPKIISLVLKRVGVDSKDDIIDQNYQVGDGVVAKLINDYILGTNAWQNMIAELDDDSDLDSPYLLVKKMMAYVAEQAFESSSGFDDANTINAQRVEQARNNYREFVNGPVLALLNLAFLNSEILRGAIGIASDDLTLLDFVAENNVLQIRSVGFSGVDKAAIFRVKNLIDLKLVTANFRSLFEQKFDNTSLTLSFRNYQVEKLGRYFYECIFIVFNKDKADSFITLTTGDDVQISAAQAPNNLKKQVAALEDIGRQRKVAASLIDDYLIRTSLSRQYEAIKKLVDVT